MKLKYIIGLTFIIFIFWNRFLRTFNNLIFVDIIEKEYHIFLSSVLVVFFGYLSYYSIKNLLKREQQHKIFIKILSFKFIKKIRTFLNDNVIDSPAYFYETLTKNLSLKKWIEMPASYFTAYFEYPRMVVFMFYVCPQIIVAMIFLIETCFYQQRIYFYKSLILLIIYILAKTIVYIFYSYSNRVINLLNLYLDITRAPEGIHISLKGPDEVPKDFPFETVIKQYNTLFNYWIIYSGINDYMKKIKNYEKKWYFHTLALTSTFYFIGWFYLLFYLINQ